MTSHAPPRFRLGAARTLALVLALAAAAPAAAEVEVRSALEPQRLAVGDTAVFSITVQAGLTTRVAFPHTLELENFEVVAGPSTRESMFWGTGRSGRTHVVRWLLQATATGVARVGPVTLSLSGEPFEVPGASAEVVESAEGRSAVPPSRPTPFGGRRSPFLGPRPPEPRLLLRAEIDDLRPWTGEQITYTLWLYAQTPVREPSLDSPPSFPGFWAEEVDLGNPSMLMERVWYEGEAWERVPLLRRVLFPLHPGEHEIPALKLSLTASMAPVDPLGMFRLRGRRLTLTGNPLTVDARPLPAPPSEFTGAVGRLALDAALEPATIALGEHATFEVELTGRGNLQGVPAPEVGTPPGLEALPPEEEGGTRIAGVEMAGRRTWRFPLVPEAAGSYRLPPVAITYFEPDAGAYRRVETPERVLTVEPAPAIAAAGDVPAAAEGADEGEPAGVAGGALAALRALPTGVQLALAAALVALAVGAGFVFGRRRNGGRWLVRWRRELERARSADRPRRAAGLLEESWRRLLVARWSLAHDLPPASWEESLREAGAAAPVAAAVGVLAHDLQNLRRAPELSAVDALTDDLIRRSRRLAGAL